jgi:hypothetical protein
MPVDNYKNLLTNAGADTGVDIIGDWQNHFGGEADFWVWGDLGGGKVHLEGALDIIAPAIVCGSDISDTSPTSAGVVKFFFGSNTKIRAVLTGSTSPSSGVFARINI